MRRHSGGIIEVAHDIDGPTVERWQWDGGWVRLPLIMPPWMRLLASAMPVLAARHATTEQLVEIDRVYKADSYTRRIFRGLAAVEWVAERTEAKKLRLT